MNATSLYKLIRNPPFLCIIAVLAFIGIFEFLPEIEKARAYVSPENYKNTNLSCQAILGDRPWYGRMNHWFFVWMAFTPAFIFLFPPQSSVWKRGARTVLAVVLCYAFMNLAVHLQWDIRNAPFKQDPFHSISEGGWRLDCLNIEDGFSLGFALVSGWIPACVYAGMGLCLWRYRHRRAIKAMPAGYKDDIAARMLIIGGGAYVIVTFIFSMALIAHKAGLFDLKPIAWMYYYTLRPLLIPFEIFVY